MSWLEELSTELENEESVDETADSVEAAERLLAQMTTQRDSTLDACVSTTHEGESLLNELRCFLNVDALKLFVCQYLCMYGMFRKTC